MSQESLRQVIHSAYSVLNDEDNFDLLKFEDSFIAQVGLLGLQLLWTRDAEDALSYARTEPAAMREANSRFLKILNQLIEVTTRELTPLERTKYETLITIHVHQKDIFDDLVSENRIAKFLFHLKSGKLVCLFIRIITLFQKSISHQNNTQ